MRFAGFATALAPLLGGREQADALIQNQPGSYLINREFVSYRDHVTAHRSRVRPLCHTAAIACQNIASPFAIDLLLCARFQLRTRAFPDVRCSGSRMPASCFFAKSIVRRNVSRTAITCSRLTATMRSRRSLSTLGVA